MIHHHISTNQHPPLATMPLYIFRFLTNYFLPSSIKCNFLMIDIRPNVCLDVNRGFPLLIFPFLFFIFFYFLDLMFVSFYLLTRIFSSCNVWQINCQHWTLECPNGKEKTDCEFVEGPFAEFQSLFPQLKNAFFD